MLRCARCGRTWPVSWRDQPGWPCRNTSVIDPARRFHGRPCMGILEAIPPEDE